MLKAKIHDYFDRYPELRVLFFFDESGEYREEVEQLDLGDIQKAHYGNNAFSLKWQLLSEGKDQRTFLYLPMAQPASQEAYHRFPLLGLLIANKALQLDDVGAFMEQYALQRHQKSLVSKYMKELQYATVQEVCKPVLTAANFQEPALQKALVAAILRFRQIESWSLITAKLLTWSATAQEKELQRALKKIIDLGLADEVARQLNKVIGLSIPALDASHLRNLARGVLYNKLTQGLDLNKTGDTYAKLKVSDSGQLTQLNQMLHEVERSPLQKPFADLMESLSPEIQGEKLIEVYGDAAEFAEYSPGMIYTIIQKIHNQITASPKTFIQRLEDISLQSEIPDEVRYLMDYLVQVARVQLHIRSHKSYVLDRPEEYVQRYTESGYKADSSYRKAIKAYKKVNLAEVPATLNLESIHSELNTAYETHTDQLNREWLRCLDHFQFDYRKINLPKQYDFYPTEIAGAEQKVVVIISDALRYEAAEELLARLHGDAKNTAEMRYLLASLPSKTSVGMSQLLPGDKQFNGGDILAGGISTSGIENRSSILRQADPDALAIQYSDLEGMDRTRQREIFKSSLVYVYHDVIDSTGDKRASERRTFAAVEEAIGELKRLVKTLHATMNVARVLITADHGFLYNDREIEEKDKENLPTRDTLQSHNRYFLSQEKQDLDLGYSFPLQATTTFTDDVWVNIPYSVNRYKKQGVGHQFVHGGGSLQELVVPLIQSSRQRVEVTQKVKPMLINRGGLRIVSNILKVNLLQESEVGRLAKERHLSIALYHENDLASNQENLTLNFTSEAPSERMVRLELILASEYSNESFLKLKIFDQDDLLNPIIEERVQNKTLIQPDF